MKVKNEVRNNFLQYLIALGYFGEEKYTILADFDFRYPLVIEYETNFVFIILEKANWTDFTYRLVSMPKGLTERDPEERHVTEYVSGTIHQCLTYLSNNFNVKV